MRNRMIFGATYGNKVSQLSLTHVLGLLSSAILTHQYMSAELRLLAIDDFLKGPQALFADDAEVTHQRVMAVAKANTPVKLPNDQWRPKPATLAKPKPAGMRAMAKSYLSSALKTLLMPGGLTAPRVLLDADANPLNTGGRSFVLTNGLRTFHILFRPNRFRTFSMLIRAVNKARKFRRDRETVGADWNNRIEDYRTEAFWGKVFQETPSDTVPRDLQSDASDDKNQLLVRS